MKRSAKSALPMTVTVRIDPLPTAFEAAAIARSRELFQQARDAARRSSVAALKQQKEQHQQDKQSGVGSASSVSGTAGGEAKKSASDLMASLRGRRQPSGTASPTPGPAPTNQPNHVVSTASLAGPENDTAQPTKKRAREDDEAENDAGGGYDMDKKNGNDDEDSALPEANATEQDIDQHVRDHKQDDQRDQTEEEDDVSTLPVKADAEMFGEDEIALPTVAPLPKSDRRCRRLGGVPDAITANNSTKPLPGAEDLAAEAKKAENSTAAGVLSQNDIASIVGQDFVSRQKQQQQQKAAVGKNSETGVKGPMEQHQDAPCLRIQDMSALSFGATVKPTECGALSESSVVVAGLCESSLPQVLAFDEAAAFRTRVASKAVTFALKDSLRKLFGLFSPTPKFLDLLSADMASRELHFSLPREAIGHVRAAAALVNEVLHKDSLRRKRDDEDDEEEEVEITRKVTPVRLSVVRVRKQRGKQGRG